MDSYLAGLADLSSWVAGRLDGLESGCLRWGECPKSAPDSLQPECIHRQAVIAALALEATNQF